MATTQAKIIIGHLQRWLEEDDVRDNVAQAVKALRRAVSGPRGARAVSKAAKTKTRQRQFRRAVFSFGRAAAAAREAEERRERSRRRRRIALLILTVVGVAGGIGLSGPARAKLRELMGGQEQASEPPHSQTEEERGPDAPA